MSCAALRALALTLAVTLDTAPCPWGPDGLALHCIHFGAVKLVCECDLGRQQLARFGCTQGVGHANKHLTHEHLPLLSDMKLLSTVQAPVCHILT